MTFSMILAENAAISYKYFLHYSISYDCDISLFHISLFTCEQFSLRIMKITSGSSISYLSEDATPNVLPWQLKCVVPIAKENKQRGGSRNLLQRQRAFTSSNHSAKARLVKSPKIWEHRWNFPPAKHSGVAAWRRRREPWGHFFHQPKGFSGLVVFQPPRSSFHRLFYETLQLLFCDGTKKTEAIDVADSVSLTTYKKKNLTWGWMQAIDGALTNFHRTLCTRCSYMMLHTWPQCVPGWKVRLLILVLLMSLSASWPC